VIDVAVKKKKQGRIVRAKPPARQAAAKKQVSLYYPKPDEMNGRVRVEPPKIPPHAEPLDITPSRGMKSEGKKKALPYTATAVGGAFLLSGSLALFFYFVINLDAVFSLMLALPFFIGLSILFYNFLELSERAQ